MASVNFGLKEYDAVVIAAHAAHERGDRVEAACLNELASKMNKALSTSDLSRSFGAWNPFGSKSNREWRAPGPLDKELGIE